jgi:hypothetical protein
MKHICFSKILKAENNLSPMTTKYILLSGIRKNPLTNPYKVVPM